jgi:serine protease
MRRAPSTLFLGIVLLCAACGGGESPFDTGVAQSCDALESDALVSTSQPLSADGTGRYIVHYRAGTDGDSLLAPYGNVRRNFAHRKASTARLSPVQAQALSRNPDVLKIEEDAVRRPFAQTLPSGTDLIQAPAVWSQQPGGRKGMKTCIIDSGFHWAHADLQKSGVTGIPSDWNMDGCGHGTHVAGTLAALENDFGTVGIVHQGLDLVIVKIFGSDCAQTASSDLADAVDQCVDAGARVINMSLGGDVPTDFERAAFENAWKRGVVIVAAAGNDGSSSMQYPASYASVISVAASTGTTAMNSTIADFSQRNPQVDLAAPGVSILSTSPFEARHWLTVGDKKFYGAGFEFSRSTGGVQGTLVSGGTCGTAPGSSWSGKIVLCARGGYSFSQKVSSVQKGGGIAAIIYNNEPGLFVGTLGTDAGWTIPVISLSQEDGLVAKNLAGNSSKVVNQDITNGSGYLAMSGTSMASPHVAGVASLVWGEVPLATNAQVRASLENSALDLGPKGRDNASGYGLVQAKSALDVLRTLPSANVPPIPAFSTRCHATSCTFTSTSLDPDGQVRSWRFDLGDGTIVFAPQATHTFKGIGPFNVTLTVLDDDGVVSTLTQTVSVLSAQVSVSNVTGTSKAKLSWQGVAETEVLVLKDGKLLDSVDNSGDFQEDITDPDDVSTYQVCTRSMESCSETRTFRCR